MRKTKGPVPVFRKPKGYTVISHKATFIAEFGRDRVFVKFTDIKIPKDRPDLLGLWRVEKTALKVLNGLAVPERIDLPDATLRRMVDSPSLHFVTQRHVEGDTPHRLRLSMSQAIAIWLFVVEQLVAFRRRQILYVDVKSQNIVGTVDPLRMTIVDFDRVIVVSPRGIYKTSHVSLTPGWAAPEHTQATHVSERTLVFPVGILLLNLVYPAAWSLNLHQPGGFLSKLSKRLTTAGMPGLARLLKECLDYNVKRRPENYEAVWERARKLLEREVPRRIIDHWRTLRAPYVRALEESDL